MAKKIFACLFLLGFLSACATQGGTIGDGYIDEVESAGIRVAVGLAMTAMPETIVPAEYVSKALLAVMEGDEIVTLDFLDNMLYQEIGKLDLTPVERASFSELVSLAKAKIKSEISVNIPDPGQRLVVVRTVVQIIYDAAHARLDAAD